TGPEGKVVWRDGSLYPARPPEVAEDAAWPADRGGGQLWIGSDGKLVAGTYGDEPKVLDPAKQAELAAHPPAPKYPRSPGVYAEWIAACKGGAPTGSTFDGHAGGLTSMVRLGCLAVRLGRERWPVIPRSDVAAHARLCHRPRAVLRRPRAHRRTLRIALRHGERESVGQAGDREPLARLRPCYARRDSGRRARTSDALGR